MTLPDNDTAYPEPKTPNETRWMTIATRYEMALEAIIILGSSDTETTVIRAVAKQALERENNG
jgi:hypothetical protein